MLLSLISASTLVTIQAGAKRAGKQAARQAPAPVRSAFSSAKKQAKQPAKAAGGLFSGATNQVKQPAKAAGGLLGSTKAQVQKPAKAAGGLFGGGKPASPKQVLSLAIVGSRGVLKVHDGVRSSIKDLDACAAQHEQCLRAFNYEQALKKHQILKSLVLSKLWPLISRSP